LKIIWLAAPLIILLIAIPIIAVFTIHLPATARYNRLFGGHVTMAMDQATFEGIEDQINIIWNQMNATFSGYDYNTIKGAWYLNNAPAAYWLAWWLTPTEIALLLTLIATVVWTALKRGWTKRQY